MAFTENYRRQIGLLLRAIPFIAKEKCFALKGGTAINLFIRAGSQEDRQVAGRKVAPAEPQ